MTHPEYAKFQRLLAQQQAEENALCAQLADSGRLSARQRLAQLFDPDSGRELFRFARGSDDPDFRDGLVCAHGTVHGRPVIAWASEFQVQGGSLGALQARQMAETYRLARQSGIPLVALVESGGARISEAVHVSEGYALALREAVATSGIVPQVVCTFGHCIGASAVMATLGDFLLMEADSTLSVAGARVNRSATGEDLSDAELGGAAVHTRHTGNVHFVCAGEAAVLAQARELLRWLPANHAERPPQFVCHDPAERLVPNLHSLIPADDTTPFDMLELIRSCCDQGDFCEVQAEFAPNLITGFAAFGGQTLAIVASQPLHAAGALDPAAARKCARFLNFVACFNYPLLSLLDVPGALPTLQAQQDGMLTHLTQVLHAVYQVHGLKITLVVRRLFGGTYVLLNPKSGDGDLIFAYPQAMIGVMSDQAMAGVLSQSQRGQAQVERLHAQGLRLDDPLLAAAPAYIDDILDPAETRREIIRALKTFGQKRITHHAPRLQPNPPL
jgi:acetyl-CoA carboxylase carboxyltransferase component